MDTKYDLKDTGGERIVYVRPVPVAELPREVQAQASGLDHIYAVHDADGARLAFVKDRRMAFILAQQNDMSIVNVH